MGAVKWIGRPWGMQVDGICNWCCMVRVLTGVKDSVQLLQRLEPDECEVRQCDWNINPLFKLGLASHEGTHLKYHMYNIRTSCVDVCCCCSLPQDDVPEAVKNARLQAIIAAYREGLATSMTAEIGRRHLVSTFC